MSYVTDLAKSGKAISSLNPLNEIAYITKNLGTSSAYAKEAIGFWTDRLKPIADTSKPVAEKIVAITPAAVAETNTDYNGVIDTTTPGYDPSDYTSSSAAGSTISGSTIFGYLVVGLVGIVILDRLMK